MWNVGGFELDECGPKILGTGVEWEDGGGCYAEERHGCVDAESGLNCGLLNSDAEHPPHLADYLRIQRDEILGLFETCTSHRAIDDPDIETGFVIGRVPLRCSLLSASTFRGGINLRGFKDFNPKVEAKIGP